MREKKEEAGQAPETGGSEPFKLQPPFLIRIPARRNPRLQKVIERVNADVELDTLWQVVNMNAVKRLGMADHGPVHVQIVTNIALRLLRLLADRGVQPSSVSDFNLETEDAEVIVVLGALFHDIGMSVHRAGHEMYSLFLAENRLKNLLDGIYDVPTRTILTSEILHAIISHRADSHPMTLEAGVVRVADALDMEEGRTRIPFQAGQINIHSVSAAAIEKITIEPGEVKPIRIVVGMNNSAGIFQLDELLKNKLEGSGLEAYVEVDASIQGETERKLIHTFRI
jgi:metal-dependent HD superfamily phosphatase/phosphodiesterase